MNYIQQTSRYDHEGKARHYQRTYEYWDEQGAVQWDCDVFGSCISARTVFTPQAPGREGFTMTAKGKLMNATYYLDDPGGRRLATITCLAHRISRHLPRVVPVASKSEPWPPPRYSGYVTSTLTYQVPGAVRTSPATSTSSPAQWRELGYLQVRSLGTEASLAACRRTLFRIQDAVCCRV